MLARLDAWMLGNLSAAHKFAKCVVDLTIMTAQNVRLILHNLRGFSERGEVVPVNPIIGTPWSSLLSGLCCSVYPGGFLGIWMTSIPSSHIISLFQICRRESLCCDLCWAILCGVAS